MSFKNLFLITVFLVISCLKSMAQVPTPGVVLPLPNLPSANATALGIYGNYPISYTNGTPSISISLYDIKTPKLSLPISLSYHANGIKVHEQATSVGLGWTLNAGGAITRQINDLPDFDYNGYKHKLIVKGVHASPAIGSSPALLDSMTDEQRYYYGRLSGAPNQSGLQKYDGQPDDFFYNFGGKSGKFILKNTVDSALAASFTTIPYSPLKIAYTEQYLSTGDSFTISDVDGTAYVFGRSVKDNSAATETSHTLTTADNSYVDQTGHTVTSPSASETGTNVTAWYLTEIISYDRTDTIFFKYASQYNAANNMTYQGKSTNLFYPYSAGAPFFTPTYNTSLSQVTTNNINLSEIDFKNGKVVFEYASRTDRGTYRLNRIRVYQLKGSQFTELKRWDMNQSYFNSYQTSSQVLLGTGDTSTTKRLRLDGITEEGVNADGTSSSKPPYTFNYHDYSGTIAYLGEYGQDLWGYWNGQANTSLIIGNPLGNTPNRVPEPAHLIAGTISTIKYPTGGSTEFQFEPNKTTRSYTSSDSTFQIYNLSTVGLYGSTSTDQTFTASQTITAILQFSITSGCTSGCLENMAQVYLNDMTAGGTQVAFLGFPAAPPLPYSGQLGVSLIAGHVYHFYFPSPGSGSQTPRYHLDANLSHAGLLNVTSTPHTDSVFTGGLRVTKIINRDANNAILTTRHFNYLMPYYVSGIFSGDFNTVGNGYTFLKYQLAPASWISSYSPTLVSYIKNYTENFTVSMAGASDGSLAYQEVEEYQDDQSGNSLGKTVYDFNMAKDDTTDNFSYIRINNAWRRNQLLETRIYKGSGGAFTLIKDSKNSYADLFPASQDTTRCLTVYRIFSVDDSRVLNNFQADPDREVNTTINGSEVFNANVYHVAIIGEINYRNALTSTLTTLYDLGGANPVSTQTNYFYNNADHLMVNRTETIKSNQDKAIVRTLYTTDYALDACNPGNNMASLKATLASLKTNFDAQSQPVYNQWIGYVFRRYNIDGACLSQGNSQGSNYGACTIANNMTQYDQTIINLYHQYGTMKATYLDSVRQAVNNYNSNMTAYTGCYSTQFSAAADSLKALLIMQQNNQLAPVETDETWVNQSTNTEYMASVTKVAFKTSNGFAQPGKSLIGTFNGNIAYNTYIAQQNNYLRTDMNLDSYNPTGNLVAYHKTAGTESSFIWGYNQQYLIGQIKNAANNDVFYDSFEEGNGTSTDAMTGHYSFNGVTTDYTKTLSGLDTGTYVLSYWKKVGSAWSWVINPVHVTGSIYGVNIPAGNEIDDVRFYPAAAQMTTYTYDPLIGITSMTDPKGEITYYEYDNFQRLMNIRDKDGNIVKHTDYHYQGQ